MHGRHMRLGLLTVLGLARRGFFIPHRYAHTLPRLGHNQSYEQLEAVMTAASEHFDAVLEEIDKLAVDLSALGNEPPPAPRWKQDWFPTLDAAVAYTMVRVEQPKRIIEVGSGHSTRFMKRASDDGDLETHITAIDAQPSRFSDKLNIEVICSPLRQVERKVFSTISPGDILFIDSSHILMPGSDVDDLFNRIIPTLPSGVLLHIHDIFLPDDYPANWEWRGYNEQQGVAPMITGGAVQILFASHFVKTRMAKKLSNSAVARLPGTLAVCLLACG